MGKIADSLASRVSGVSVSSNGTVTITTEHPLQALNDLVGEYSAITGPLGVRMCYSAAREMLERHPEVSIDAFRALVG